MQNSKLKPFHLMQVVRSRLGLPASFVPAQLGATAVTLRYGTLSAGPDYDYGWTYALITQSRVFFDVGSNVGLDTLIACTDDAERKIVALDANQAALAELQNHLRKNNIPTERVEIAAGFVSDKDEATIEFFTVGTGCAGSRYRSMAHSADKAKSSFTVQSFTLDSVCAELKLEPDFIKMDIEGAETDALEGARQLCSRSRPTIIVEMHTREELSMADAVEKVLSWCRELNYTAYYLAKHAPLVSGSQVAHRGRCHVLLQPQELPYPEYLRLMPEATSIDAAYRIMKDAGLLGPRAVTIPTSK